MNRKKIFISNNGCLELLLDSMLFKAYFKDNRMEIVKDFRKADIILFGTCAFNEKMERNSLKRIGKFNRYKKDSAKLIVHGCLPRINKDEMDKIFKGDFFSPELEYDLNKLFEFQQSDTNLHYNVLDEDNIEYARVRKLLHKFENIRNNIYKRTKIKLFPRFDIRPFVGEGKIYNVKTSIGCLGNCAYCAVRFAKGKIKSYPIDKIYNEFIRGLKVGYKHFVLSGDDLGCYGMDIGTDLVKLLDRLLDIKGDYKIILRDIEPHFLIEMFSDLIEIFRSGKIFSLCSPVQSGSNKILKLMKRKYEIEDFINYIDKLNKLAPEVKVRTVIMVGFPYEEEADFRQSLNILDKVKFDMVDVYSYSKRPNTGAATMNNQVPEPIKRIRQIRAYFKVYRKIYLKNLSPLFRKDNFHNAY